MAALKVTYKDPPPAESRGHGIRARTLPSKSSRLQRASKNLDLSVRSSLMTLTELLREWQGRGSKTHRHERRPHRARRPSDPAQIRAYVIAVFAERLRAGCPREPVIAAWGIGRDGQKVLLHLVSGSKEDTETVRAFFQDMRAGKFEQRQLDALRKDLDAEYGTSIARSSAASFQASSRPETQPLSTRSF